MNTQIKHNFKTEPEFCQAMVDFVKEHGFPLKYKEHHLRAELNAYADAHPEKHIMELKSRGYERMAEALVPHIFPQIPFYRKFADLSNGTNTGVAPGSWLMNRNIHIYRDVDPEKYDHFTACNRHGLHLSYNLHDHYHHSVPHINILGHGLKYYYEEAQKELANTSDPEEQQFLK